MVSDNGGGDYWFVKAEDGGRAVWFWSHESHEAREDAPTVAAHLTKRRDRVRREARPPEVLAHPALGPLAFDGHRYAGRAGGLEVYLSVVPVPAEERTAVLDLAGELVPRAAAAERAVLEAALPELVEVQHGRMWWLPDHPRLTTDQLRERLTAPALNVHPGRTGDGWALTVHYVYDGGEAFGWDAVCVAADADLRVAEVMRLG